MDVPRELGRDAPERLDAAVRRPALELLGQDHPDVEVLGGAPLQAVIEHQARASVQRQGGVRMAELLLGLQRPLDDQVLLGPGVGVAAVEGGEVPVRLHPRWRHVYRRRHDPSSLVQPAGRRLEGRSHAVLHHQAPAGAVDPPQVAAGLEVQVGGDRPRQDPESQLGEDLGDDIEEARLPARVDAAEREPCSSRGRTA